MSEFNAAWWWIDRWRKSTAYTDMSAEEQGVYRNLLDELWLRDGILPLSEKALAQISGDARAWERVKKSVLARFRRTPDGYRNDTHDEIAAQSKLRRDFQSMGGKARAAAAAREGGRFASTLTSTLDQQAGTAAGEKHQPEHQQRDQPPSPSPSPDPLNPPKPPLGKGGPCDNGSPGRTRRGRRPKPLGAEELLS